MRLFPILLCLCQTCGYGLPSGFTALFRNHPRCSDLTVPSSGAARCDARMSRNVKKTTIRDLRYRFPEIESRLNKGQEIVLHKRQKIITRLLPARSQRFARVEIFPKPKSRSSAVTRVNPSTPAVAAKKRSAGSW
jgi:antitoxin (DNA-binding transcriptional repressor) of toxin-antitoxin stability system